ncbi:ABC transporter ATP-binding protein [Paraconexibacter algicola]|uniref:ABC transporter ATP-binding protein n=1 Tax=Paraconexibacter algicola TaxID=2133960 RepID=A0A2T4UH44_9ACTN|nr:ABC transporter ATP-binding protein [Paraconexibacter algicola]PTL58515.1 ABC transporter ATP-binding protein [Paraconexibacter algicola]
MSVDRPDPLLEVRGVDVRIGGTAILHGCDLTARAGELVAVVGPNGAGKSTLGRVAAGLLAPAAGTVRWGGQDVGAVRARRRPHHRAYVPQRGRVPDGIRVREAVELGRAPHVGLLGRPTTTDHDAIDRALARTRMTGFAQRRLSTLSGGELQRAQLSVALAQEAPLLLADEPTASLDLGAAVTVARLLRALADDGLAVVLVVHDLALAAAIADTVVVVHRGRTVATGPAEEVLTPDRLAAVWEVDAELDPGDGARTALRVGWRPVPHALEGR